MCVSAYVIQNLFRTAERWLGVDHPFGIPDWGEVLEEGAMIPKRLQRREKLELIFAECPLEIF
jgi:hypothetical protein